MIQMPISVKGLVEREIRRADGSVEVEQIPNRFTDQGLNFFANRVIENTDDLISYMAVGSSDADLSDDADSLDDELYRTELTESARTDNELKFEAEWLDGAAEGEHREAALHLADDGDSDDEMISRVTFPVRNIGSEDSIIYRWYVTVQRA